MHLSKKKLSTVMIHIYLLFPAAANNLFLKSIFTASSSFVESTANFILSFFDNAITIFFFVRFLFFIFFIRKRFSDEID